MQDDTTYHALANATLLHLADRLEDAFDEGAIDDFEHGETVLSIEAGGKVVVVSKHEATRQIWLASPISGGLHFFFDSPSQSWITAEGNELKRTLAQELAQLCGARLIF